MTTELQNKIAKNNELIEKELEKYFKNTGNDDLDRILEAERYSVLGGGKRIRPFIVNEMCRMLGGDLSQSLPYACAIERRHVYSLIHDDLPCMDDDDTRRGRPSSHKEFGYATALLAGDALLTKAFGVAAGNTAVSAEINVEAIKVLSRTAGDLGMIGGQVMDLAGETRELELEEILMLHSMKTGALMMCAALLGCLAAGYTPDSEEAKRASLFARKIGMAFQVIDDMLDEVGEEDELGKNIHSDAEHNKSTFMTYYDCEGAKKYAEELTAEAISEISVFEGSETLTDLAAYLLDRTY